MRARTAIAVGLAGAVGVLAATAGGQTGEQPGKQPPAVAPKVPEAKKAKQEPLDRAELDKRVARVVNNAIITGVNLWADERVAEPARVEGTFRLYQGTLAAVVPLLDHRPTLMVSAGYKLKQGSSMRSVEGAFLLREALDEIQKETAPALIVKPLWERLGGEEGVRAIAKDFVDAAAKDPKANLSRGGKYKLDEKELKTLQDRVTEAISVVGRGPLEWNGLQSTIKTLVGLELTREEIDALTGHLLAALKKNKAGDAEVTEVFKSIAALRTGIGK